MKNDSIKYTKIIEAKKNYKLGINITKSMRDDLNSDRNTPEIIELAYDLQAGSYINYVKKNLNKVKLYTDEVSSILDSYLDVDDVLLDIGTGEITTLSLISNGIKDSIQKILAFDISFSRIYKGISFAKKNMSKNSYNKLVPFVADINEIPLPDKSINVTTSSHALEPNGGKLNEIMIELFRITIKKLILFEPCYEINSEEGKKRMDDLGYIKNLDYVVESLGGKIEKKIVIKNTSNPLNPTVCFVISPPSQNNDEFKNIKNLKFSLPGSNILLKENKNFLISEDTGLLFPKIKNIPILKLNSSILATILS